MTSQVATQRVFRKQLSTMKQFSKTGSNSELATRNFNGFASQEDYELVLNTLKHVLESAECIHDCRGFVNTLMVTQEDGAIRIFINDDSYSLPSMDRFQADADNLLAAVRRGECETENLSFGYGLAEDYDEEDNTVFVTHDGSGYPICVDAESFRNEIVTEAIISLVADFEESNAVHMDAYKCEIASSNNYDRLHRQTEQCGRDLTAEERERNRFPGE